MNAHMHVCVHVCLICLSITEYNGVFIYLVSLIIRYHCTLDIVIAFHTKICILHKELLTFIQS